MTEIRIYVEGGGDHKDTRQLIRKGFGHFLKDIRNLARSRRIKWNIVACGSRNSAREDFSVALNSNSDAFNVLLVDSEGAVNANISRWQYLKVRDGWAPPGIEDAHCHLMVQTMESWFIADIDALRDFYGQGFNENSIPKNRNVEEIDKPKSALKDATKHTKTKGVYHKTRHAPKLLEKIDASKVRASAPHCDHLFKTLIEQINAS